jgi:hypothetical protein
MLIISALGRLKQEDIEFEATWIHLKTKQQTTTKKPCTTTKVLSMFLPLSIQESQSVCKRISNIYRVFLNRS